MLPSALQSLRMLCLELFGLTLTMAGVMVIAAYWYFGSFSLPAAQSTLVFCLLMLFVSVLPLQLYAATRIVALRRANHQLFHIATRDGLTKVLNRAAFQKSVELRIGQEGRRRAEDDVPHTLLILDADHFKRINDRLGHGTGDQALSLIAATLRQSVRKDDLVGRLGGEEFAVLLRNAGFEEAQIVAERLRARINMLEVGPRSQRTRLSVSLGGIAFRTAVPFDALYKIADTNLYKAKSAGRNRVTLSQLGALRSVGEPGRQIEGAARRWA
ncbi:GGDEF domain-containing protein [Aureimonas sp. AU20]|uniref:GGDEF domain-containing protein n=2 Tax=Aureimonas sp. AU20 TaxID=1349819 RepID=UPI0009EC8BB9|nr:GGDEF domain-containing protein [Aureimonas sp. AU20]